QTRYCLPDRARFVDAEGQVVALPDAGSGRSVTVVERQGQPVAVLVHDPAVLEDPGLLEAVTAAAQLAAANARLRAEGRGRGARGGGGRVASTDPCGTGRGTPAAGASPARRGRGSARGAGGHPAPRPRVGRWP